MKSRALLIPAVLLLCLALTVGGWASGEAGEETVSSPTGEETCAAMLGIYDEGEPAQDGAGTPYPAAEAAALLSGGESGCAAEILRALVGLADETASAPASSPEPAPTEAPAYTEPAELTVRFIDVGQADAALLTCGGEAMLIDGGNTADSSLIYSVLERQGLDYLDYIVCTHAHEDHVGGLSGALNYATAGTAYCSVTEYDSQAFRNFVKYLDAQGTAITVPQPGDAWTLGGAQVMVLGPVSDSTSTNDQSVVLRIVYGDVSFLFTGDAERDEEAGILDAGYNVKSTVLKVGHHGSYTSTSYRFLYEVEPEYAVISCGAGNSYGHPHEATLSRLRDADVTVFRTDLQGDVVCVTDGTTVTFTTERNADIDTLEEVRPTEAPAAPGTYVINTNTGVFHYPACASVSKMSEKNRLEFTGTRDEIIAMGYRPCGNCDP